MYLEVDARLLGPDGNPLPELQCLTNEETRTVTCWVESQLGQPFSICVEQDLFPEQLRINLLMDGVEVGDCFLEAQDGKRYISRVRAGPRHARCFQFAYAFKPIEEYDEEEQDETNALNWKSRGTIQIRVYKAIFFYSHEPSPAAPDVLMDGLYSVQLGEKQAYKSPKIRVAEWEADPEWGMTPCATFIWKHRPRAWLEQYGFVERNKAELDIDLSAMSITHENTLEGDLRALTLQDQEMEENGEKASEAATLPAEQIPLWEIDPTLLAMEEEEQLAEGIEGLSMYEAP